MICRGCSEDKPLEEYPIRNDRSGRARPYCHSCSNNIARARYKAYQKRDYFKWKCTKTKARAKRLNLLFDLTPEYLKEIWTGYCPITKEILSFDENWTNSNSAELDKIIPELGYIKGNVAFISRRMNKIKSEASYSDIIKLGEWLGNYTY